MIALFTSEMPTFPLPKGPIMKTSLKTSLTLAALLGAIAGPALAGNYAEGDPRPAPLTSSTSRAAATPRGIRAPS